MRRIVVFLLRDLLLSLDYPRQAQYCFHVNGEISLSLSLWPTLPKNETSSAHQVQRIAGPKKIYHYCLWTMSTIFVLMNLISFFYIIFRCDPISFAWDMKNSKGTCLPSEALADIYYADTAVNIITDWCCALL